jgi:hypothetical protein
MRPTIELFHVRIRRPIFFAHCEFGYRRFDLCVITYWFGVIVAWNAPHWERKELRTGIEFAWNRRIEPIEEGCYIHRHRWSSFSWSDRPEWEW